MPKWPLKATCSCFPCAAASRGLRAGRRGFIEMSLEVTVSADTHGEGVGAFRPQISVWGPIGRFKRLPGCFSPLPIRTRGNDCDMDRPHCTADAPYLFLKVMALYL